MQITLVGLGCGSAETMTVEGRSAVEQADLLVGAQRLLDALPPACTGTRTAAIRPQEILDALRSGEYQRPCVVYSGDTGFYSGTRGLLPLLERESLSARILPGISSVQLLSARLGRPWQDWTLCSAHGAECDVVSAVMGGKPTFFLTGGTLDAAAVCRELTAAGLGGLPAAVGENLSYPEERIVRGTAAELALVRFAPLAVLLTEGAPRPCPPRTAGLPDEAFLRTQVPMTKQEVRAAVLAKLAVKPSDTVWDVGAGTGSVSIELSRAAARVFAVECDQEACDLIEQNRTRLGAWNLHLVRGKAPDALRELPAPDAVFIGGSKGEIDGVLDDALGKNPAARICVSAIALETLASAAAAMTARGRRTEVTQIAVSRSRPAGKLHLLTANNPVFLITGQPEDGAV